MPWVKPRFSDSVLFFALRDVGHAESAMTKDKSVCKALILSSVAFCLRQIQEGLSKRRKDNVFFVAFKDLQGKKNSPRKTNHKADWHRKHSKLADL